MKQIVENTEKLIKILGKQDWAVHGIEVFLDGTVIAKRFFQADIRYPV